MKAKAIYTFVLLLFFGKIFSQDVIWKNIFYSDMSPAHGYFQPYYPFLLNQDSNLNTYLGATLHADGEILSPKLLDLDPDVSNTANVICFDGNLVYISKYSKEGKYLWHKAFSFPAIYNNINNTKSVPNPWSYHSVQDKDGNIYLAGNFFGSVDFDPSPTIQNILTSNYSPSQQQYVQGSFILKLDSNGSLKWVKQFLDSTNIPYIPNINDIKLDGNGKLHFVGGPYHFVLDNSGNLISFKSFSNLTIESILFSKSGETFFSGSFSNTVDFDFGVGVFIDSSTSINQKEIFVLRTDSLQNFKNVTIIRSVTSFSNFVNLRKLLINSKNDIYFGSIPDSFYIRNGHSSFTLIPGQLNQYRTIVLDSVGAYSRTLMAHGESLITGIATKNFTNVSDTSLLFSGLYSQDSKGSVYYISGEQFSGNDGGAYHLDNHAQVLTKIGRRCDFIELDNNISSINDTLTTNSGGVYQWVNCANNFAPIVGETNLHFEPTTSGNFAVVMYKSGCKDTSECVNFNTLGFNKSYENSEFQLYPNPTTDILFIETNRYTSITIQDLNGKILQTQDVDKQGQIDISSLSSGMYLLRTKEGVTRKFIKE